jgi:cytochrome c-type biogenesis protein CcmH/NrfF
VIRVLEIVVALGLLWLVWQSAMELFIGWYSGVEYDPALTTTDWVWWWVGVVVQLVAAVLLLCRRRRAAPG